MGGGLTGTANAVMPTSNAGVIGDANTSLDLGMQVDMPLGTLYLSGGVYLGGTGSANKLDDYEQATFHSCCFIVEGFTISSTTAR